MKTELYVVVVLPPDDEPYVWSDNTCSGEAYCSASEAFHETGCRAVVKTVLLYSHNEESV